MKRFLIAIAVSATVFGGIYGLAASLSVTSSTLGAGTVAVAACQSTAINVTYTPTYDATATAGYDATTVTLNGLDTAANKCGSKSFKVTLTGASDASLSEEVGTLPSTGTTHGITFTNVSAAAVTGVHVTIYG
jgi:hypothetical protein